MFLLTALSCKKDPKPTTCQEKILGDWVCSSINDAAPDLGITLNFESDSDGEFRVTENGGIEHLYFVDTWTMTECDRLEFTYFVQGFEHANDLKINSIQENALELTGGLLDVFDTDTRFVFKRR